MKQLLFCSLIIESLDLLEKAISDGEKNYLTIAHYKYCFGKVEELLADGFSSLNFQKESKVETAGVAVIFGPEEDCVRFQKRIKEMGIGNLRIDANHSPSG